MLGKLIKYDIKSTYIYFLIMHGILLISCILGRFLVISRFDFIGATMTEIYTLIIFGSLFFLLILLVPVGTSFLLIIRFYRNMFSDEGYLTLTIPASRLQLLWSKILFSVLVSVLDTLLIALSVWILIYTPNVVAAYLPLAADFHAEMGMSMSSFLGMMFSLSLFGSLFSGITLYFCATVGQKLPHHPVVGTVLTYFVFTAVLQFFTFLLMMALGLFPSPSLLMESSNAHYISNVRNYYATLCIMSAALTVFVSVFQYAVTHYLLTRKLNLD